MSKKMYKVKYVCWEEKNGILEQDGPSIWMYAISTFEDALAIAKDLVDIYINGNDGKEYIKFEDERTVGCFHDEVRFISGDGIRAWIV